MLKKNLKNKYANMQDVVWNCTYCRIRQSEGDEIVEKFVTEYICTFFCDEGEFLRFTISKSKPMQRTIEKVKAEENLVVLVITVIMNNRNEFICCYYHKHTYTGKF